MSQTASSSGQAMKPNENAKVFSGHTNQIVDIQVSPDGRSLLSCSYDETIRLWDIASGNEVHCYKGHGNWVKAISFSRDGKKFVSCSLDGNAKVWDTNSGKQLINFPDHQTTIQAIAYSPTANRAISGSEDGAVRLWDTDTGKEIKLLGEHMTGVIDAAISPNGQYGIAAIGKAIMVWDLNTFELLHKNEINKNRLEGVTFSPDSQYMLSCCEDGVVRLINTQKGDEVRAYNGYNRWLHNAIITSDSRYVLAGYDYWIDDKPHTIVRRWALENNKEWQDFYFTGHRMSISMVAFFPDGSRVISASSDKTLRLYDITN